METIKTIEGNRARKENKKKKKRGIHGKKSSKRKTNRRPCRYKRGLTIIGRN